MPTETQSREGSAFCGKWGEADWDGVLPHCLVVEGSPGNLHAVYAWGLAPEWNIQNRGWMRAMASAEGDTLKMRLGNGAKVGYQLVDGLLHGTYRLPGLPAAAVVLDRAPE